MADPPHIDLDRLVAFLNENEQLTPEEHEHVLACDECLEAAAKKFMKQQGDRSGSVE